MSNQTTVKKKPLQHPETDKSDENYGLLTLETQMMLESSAKSSTAHVDLSDLEKLASILQD